MALRTYNNFIARGAADFILSQPMWGEMQTAGNVSFGDNIQLQMNAAVTKALPSLPSGVTSYIPLRFMGYATNNTSQFLLAKVFVMGSLDISSNVFTDGSQYPTVTEAGVSRQIFGPIIACVTTVLNALPGTLTVTYVDKDNNSAETSVAGTPTASAVVNSSGFVRLNAGDIGAIDVTNAARSGGTTPTGVITFYGVIPIGFMGSVVSAAGLLGNFLTDTICPIRLGAGDVLSLINIPRNNAYTGAVVGNLHIIGED